MSEERLNEPQAAFEAALASLRWRPSALDPARVMYLAGQASVLGPKEIRRPRRAGWLWPMATAASLLLAAALGVTLLVSPRQTIVERVVHVPGDRSPDSATASQSVAAAIAASHEPPLRTDYLELRHLVLTQGVDAWRVAHGSQPPRGDTLTPRDAYHGLIDPDRSG